MSRLHLRFTEIPRRAADWPAGLYSLVRFELKPAGTATALVLDHSSFPAGGYTHLSSGWHDRYWTPLAKYLNEKPSNTQPCRRDRL
jgi:hypothetical protein